MGRATEPVGGGTEMRRAGSLDRLGLPLSVWTTELDCQQQSLLDPARLESAEYRPRVLSLTERRVVVDWKRASDILYCCWRHLLIQSASMAASTAQQTESIWG